MEGGGWERGERRIRVKYRFQNLANSGNS